ncbi:hypothetical protein, partial [Vibrio mediterranei]|uniref:hypothetical protein n=1 Tax=Vibrio mediterranei TaxID=689 RepID=UPI00406835C9
GRDTLHELDQPLKELAYVSNHWGPLLSAVEDSSEIFAADDCSAEIVAASDSAKAGADKIIAIAMASFFIFVSR